MSDGIYPVGKIISLASLNDEEKLSFEQIANKIEEYSEYLFGE